jgi:outer membrane lipoprotein carrier protein
MSLVCLFWISSLSLSALTLNDFVKNVQTFKSDFAQTIIDPKGVVVGESIGQLWVKAPNQMRWQDDQSQQIILDGQSLWIYDEDLAQVTQQPSPKDLAQIPLLILGKDEKTLSRHFKISKLYEKPNRTAGFRLLIQNHAYLSSLELYFEKGVLRQLKIQEKSKQVTELRLTRPVLNSIIESSLFEFEVPVGVDLIRPQRISQ